MKHLFGFRYNCTLLKDLPNYAAGTKFTIIEAERRDDTDYYCQFPDDKLMCLSNYKITRSVIDNPIWVKKELDEGCLTEVSCRNCGSTKLLMKAYVAPYEYDDGVYSYRRKIVGICTCGCENEYFTFTSHTKVHY